ncbi:MAG: lasso peptide biosynthesis PqqD family chaperone [Micromonosporaceae bacterium]
MSLRLRAHVLLTETDDGAVLLDEKTGRYWQLNRSGSLILKTLLDGGAPEQAAAAVAARYPVDEARALDDVRGLLSTLHSARLARR